MNNNLRSGIEHIFFKEYGALMFADWRRKASNLEYTTEWVKILGYMRSFVHSFRELSLIPSTLGGRKPYPFISLSTFVWNWFLHRCKEEANYIWWELVRFMRCRVSPYWIQDPNYTWLEKTRLSNHPKSLFHSYCNTHLHTPRFYVLCSQSDIL